MSRFIGRVVKNPITHATPIKTTDLYLPNEFPPLVLAAGMEAMTFPTGTASMTVDEDRQDGGPGQHPVHPGHRSGHE